MPYIVVQYWKDAEMITERHETAFGAPQIREKLDELISGERHFRNVYVGVDKLEDAFKEDSDANTS